MKDKDLYLIKWNNDMLVVAATDQNKALDLWQEERGKERGNYDTTGLNGFGIQKISRRNTDY